MPALNAKNHLFISPYQTTNKVEEGRFRTVGDNNITTVYNAFDFFLSFPPFASHFECISRVVIYTTIASRLAFRSCIINKCIKYIRARGSGVIAKKPISLSLMEIFMRSTKAPLVWGKCDGH